MNVAQQPGWKLELTRSTVFLVFGSKINVCNSEREGRSGLLEALVRDSSETLGGNEKRSLLNVKPLL